MVTPWIRLSEEVLHEGYRKVARRVYHLPDGRAANFEVHLDPQVVAVLALTPQHRVILAKQYRPGPDRTLLEVPGGAVEPGELPEIAARRELFEETGYMGELHYVAENLYGNSTMLQHNFIALNCCRVAQPRLDVDEFIEVVELPLEEFRTLLCSGQLTDVATGYLGLDFLGLL
jgi:ADP-ribose pyrophosphatase